LLQQVTMPACNIVECGSCDCQHNELLHVVNVFHLANSSISAQTLPLTSISFCSQCKEPQGARG
jgi:hypothetical protein